MEDRMNQVSEYFSKACNELSEGMKEGAYQSLKAAYPKFFTEINEKLDHNFTIEGINEYRETMIRGFKKNKMWEAKCEALNAKQCLILAIDKFKAIGI